MLGLIEISGCLFSLKISSNHSYALQFHFTYVFLPFLDLIHTKHRPITLAFKHLPEAHQKSINCKEQTPNIGKHRKTSENIGKHGITWENMGIHLRTPLSLCSYAVSTRVNMFQNSAILRATHFSVRFCESFGFAI